MKRANIIRILSGLMFLIFLCPFFQRCSKEELRNGFIRTEVRNNPDLITDNGYNLSICRHILNQSWDEFIWPEVIFTIIIFVSFGILIYALKNKNLTVKILSFINVALGISFIALMLLMHTLTNIRQIKYGYYLFFINTIAIIVLSTKQIRAQNGLRTAQHNPPHPFEDNP